MEAERGAIERDPRKRQGTLHCNPLSMKREGGADSPKKEPHPGETTIIIRTN